MKKLILAVVLFAASMSMASAATVSSDGGYRGNGIGPFPAPVFVRGTMNDWGLANPMTYDAGTATYTATITLDAADYEFKLASEDWSTVDLAYLDGSQPMVSGDTINVARGAFGNIFLSIADAGSYDFILDVSSIVPGRGTNPIDGPFPLTVQQSAVVPVPAAGLLLLSALGGLGFLRRRS